MEESNRYADEPVSELPVQRPPSLFAPLFMTSLAFNLLLAAYVYSQWETVSGRVGYQKAIVSQIESQRANLVASRNLQATLQALATELYDLSSSDPDIKQIVDKYQIRKLQNPTP